MDNNNKEVYTRDMKIGDDITEVGRVLWDNVNTSNLDLADFLADVYVEISHLKKEMIIHFAITWGAPKSSLRDHLRVGRAWPRSLRDKYSYIGENYSMLRVLTDGDEPNLELAQVAEEEQMSVDKVKSLKANDTPWLLKLKRWKNRFIKWIANLSTEEKEELYQVIREELEDER